mmetsp:Transcript_9028/g.39709  ORF Transcript_9028/g.39709 Transcript_9028/m.39709 type:complete len:370 (+) Transcript_9028:6028-7137(+)
MAPLRVLHPSRARAEAPRGALHEEGVHFAPRGGEEARGDGRPRGHADDHHRDREEPTRLCRGVCGRLARVASTPRALLVAGARALAPVALAPVPRAVRLRRLARVRAARRQAVVWPRHPRSRRFRARPRGDASRGRSRSRRGAGHALEHRQLFAGVDPRALRGYRVRIHLPTVEAGLWRRIGRRARRSRGRRRIGRRRGRRRKGPGSAAARHRGLGARGRRGARRMSPRRHPAPGARSRPNRSGPGGERASSRANPVGGPRGGGGCRGGTRRVARRPGGRLLLPAHPSTRGRDQPRARPGDGEAPRAAAQVPDPARRAPAERASRFTRARVCQDALRGAVAGYQRGGTGVAASKERAQAPPGPGVRPAG